ncbi:hypothetical protein ACNOYE_05685 [Nannocystaceae bacterium ST9]
MSRFRALLLALALPGALPGCRAEELVELRLYPCEFAGIEPQSVTVEITGYDGEGTVVETFEVPFDDIAASTFADGYATVGYRKHGDVERARFRVGWFVEPAAGPIAEADAIAVYDEVGVPDAGEVLVLGELAADCAELIGEGTESGESVETTLDSSSSDTLDTSSDDVDTSSSDTMDSSSSDTLDTSTDTTDTSETTDTSGDPPGPKPGDDCEVLFGFYCSGAPEPEDAGIPLLCNDQMQLESTDLFPSVCGDICLGVGAPVDACGGIGDAACACQPIAAPDCVGEQLGCFGNELHLCFQGKVVISGCTNGCGMTPEGWFTCAN